LGMVQNSQSWYGTSQEPAEAQIPTEIRGGRDGVVGVCVFRPLPETPAS
jgi:hypothetical protein